MNANAIDDRVLSVFPPPFRPARWCRPCPLPGGRDMECGSGCTGGFAHAGESGVHERRFWAAAGDCMWEERGDPGTFLVGRVDGIVEAGNVVDGALLLTAAGGHVGITFGLRFHIQVYNVNGLPPGSGPRSELRRVAGLYTTGGQARSGRDGARTRPIFARRPGPADAQRRGPAPGGCPADARRMDPGRASW